MIILLRKKIIVSVISDLVTDQRVQKECDSFYKMGYEVCLLGRKSKRNFLLKDFPYKTIRFHNLFQDGPMMYVVFNLQLFFYLLFKKADILWSNDLDTLLPNFIISKLKKSKLVYDSHEYFTESVYKKSSRKIWQVLENLLFPQLKNVITVNDSIKSIYENKYKVAVTVIRNVPYSYKQNHSKSAFILPVNKKVLVMQGMGLNENRGAEEAVFMMSFLPDDFLLYFIGSGTIINKLKQMVLDLKLEAKVVFIDAIPYNEMMKYTSAAFLGLIFEKIDFTDEHRLALPNKFFDYIHAGIPVLSSEAVEIKLLINKYDIGDFINSFDPKEMANKVIEISEDKQRYQQWKCNTAAASKELNWQNEEKLLITFMEHLF